MICILSEYIFVICLNSNQFVLSLCELYCENLIEKWIAYKTFEEKSEKIRNNKNDNKTHSIESKSFFHGLHSINRVLVLKRPNGM